MRYDDEGMYFMYKIFVMSSQRNTVTVGKIGQAHSDNSKLRCHIHRSAYSAEGKKYSLTTVCFHCMWKFLVIL